MSLRYIKTEPIKHSKKDENVLSEIYSRTAIMPEFAVLSSDGRQVGPWMKCKDYIQDCIWGGKYEKTYNAHGFSYTHGTDPLPNLKKLHLALRFKGQTKTKLDKMLRNVKKTVEHLEKRIGIPSCQRTRFSRIIDDYFVIYGSNKWLKATHTISFFTFLIRASLNNNGGRLDTIGETSPVKKDTYYYKGGKKYFAMLAEIGIDKMEDNWDKHSKHDDCYAVHEGGFLNSCGAVVKDWEPEDDGDWDF